MISSLVTCNFYYYRSVSVLSGTNPYLIINKNIFPFYVNISGVTSVNDILSCVYFSAYIYSICIVFSLYILVLVCILCIFCNVQYIINKIIVKKNCLMYAFFNHFFHLASSN